MIENNGIKEEKKVKLFDKLGKKKKYIFAAAGVIAICAVVGGIYFYTENADKLKLKQEIFTKRRK